MEKVEKKAVGGKKMNYVAEWEWVAQKVIAN
jgi:hypothetical protein